MVSQRIYPHVLVTGAHGFVGAEVCRKLLSQGVPVTEALRHAPEFGREGSASFRQVAVGDFGPETDWMPALHNVDVVIHLAARVHVMQDFSLDPLAEFRRVNVVATESLARAAAANGVRRFIFLSSIKVNGEQTIGAPFHEQDAPNPQDPYGVSKWEAEQALSKVAAETGIEIVILRSPLIYGANVKANFLRLLRWVDQGLPLPLAWVRNRRSMIYLGNLVDALVTCIEHPAVAGNTYLLSDGEDVSTPELIRRMAKAFGKPARLWPLPLGILQGLGRLTGKTAEMDRLLGSLQVDANRFCHDTGWAPPFSMQQGIDQTVEWYRGALEK